ncbi:Hypothetical predicted protein [Octopus vulgaris]|uniref:Uncharacterized protein n=1 Tax=Octopus vulgaris TaxID=6645 RepID=A0AA36F341_OCTVU|nr:Hypothetical predicted protein [Octopus vulgaris]
MLLLFLVADDLGVAIRTVLVAIGVVFVVGGVAAVVVGGGGSFVINVMAETVKASDKIKEIDSIDNSCQ